MLDWLYKLSGRNFYKNLERDELESLRKEVARMKKKHGKGDIEEEIISDEDV
jgi:hypothetical protein